MKTAALLALVVAAGGCHADAATTVPDAGPAARCGPTVPVTFAQEDAIAHGAQPPGTRIITANANAIDLRGDGSPQMLITEPLLHQLTWLHDCDTTCQATAIPTGDSQPVWVRAVDWDVDGDRDLLLADIGSVDADTAKVGRVVLMTNDGKFHFSETVLMDGLGRVACVEPADLDRDGDVDVVVCEYGALSGSLFWLKRESRDRVSRVPLKEGAGAIHAFPIDVEGDRDLDLAVTMSEAFQQVLIFRNQGGGRFAEEVAYDANRIVFGLGGIEPADLDRDGDVDLLMVNGDYMDETFDFALQGLSWLENDGTGHYAEHRITTSLGAYGVRATDMDNDCDVDIVLASLHERTLVPARVLQEPALVWLENDGAQTFSVHPIAATIENPVSVGVIDLGGGPSVFAGSFTTRVAAESDRRLLLWRRVP